MNRECLIVQPWFSAAGHPAQSLLNTARSLGPTPGVRYLISRARGCNATESLERELTTLGSVETYRVNSTSIREGTIKGLAAVRRFPIARGGLQDLFFLDAHLVLLALLWPIFSRVMRIRKLATVYLMGPERISQSRLTRGLVRNFLQRKDVTLFLRTEELVAAWQNAFPEVTAKKIRCLPSLELPGDPHPNPARVPIGLLRFGILGQIRRGKGIEWLVPLFQRHPEIGSLTIAGAFNDSRDRRALTGLHEFKGFTERFLSEEEMLALARQQDYLLLLYEPWDARMESGVLYLAARANRPVITFAEGWCGRMVRTFGCGIVAPKDHALAEKTLANAPRPGSPAYAGLLTGLSKFTEARSAKNLRGHFLDAVFGEPNELNLTTTQLPPACS